MSQNDLYLEFLNKLKKDKSDKEVTEFLTNFIKFGSEELYYVTMMYLTDDDMQEIEKLDDQDSANAMLNEKFKLRVGMTPEEFVNTLRDQIAKEYLFPDLVGNAPKHK